MEGGAVLARNGHKPGLAHVSERVAVKCVDEQNGGNICYVHSEVLL